MIQRVIRRWVAALTFVSGIGVATVPLVGCQNEAVKTWEATGEIKSIAEDKGSVKIAHEEIKGFMEAMTMKFEVPDAKMIESIEVGQYVDFTFVGGAAGTLVLKTLEPKKAAADKSAID